MVVVLAFALGGIQIFGNRTRSDAQRLVQIIQAAYFQSLKQGKVFRIQFSEDGQSLKVERFKLPEPPPSEDDVEAYREWEKRQEEKKKYLRDLSSEERRNLSLLDRGDFELIKEHRFSSGVHVSKVLHRTENLERKNILVYPTGEIESVLVLLESQNGDAFSLTTNPITGRVEAQKGIIPEEEWKKAP